MKTGQKKIGRKGRIMKREMVVAEQLKIRI